MNPMLDTTPLLARAGGGVSYNRPTAEVGASFGVGGGGISAGGGVGGSTNTRVAGTLLVAGGFLVLLKYAGFRFNVGVSS